MKNINKYLFIISVSVFIVWVLSFILIVTTKWCWQIKGNFGDSFGVVNSLFSGMALIAVICTIFIQMKEINENKKEIDIQKLENRFYQLIKVHNDILEGIEVYHSVFPGKKQLFRGRSEFENMYNDFKKEYEPRRINAQTPIELIDMTYKTFFQKMHQYIGHYFRHLYHMIVFIDRSALNIEKKKEYIKLIRAQLSSYELALLFYNCVSSYGNKKFKPLIEKYSILEHLKNIPNLIIEDDKQFYQMSAFEELRIE